MSSSRLYQWLAPRIGREPALAILSLGFSALLVFSGGMLLGVALLLISALIDTVGPRWAMITSIGLVVFVMLAFFRRVVLGDEIPERKAHEE